ncbi:MAG: translocation/assembly module TamB domain-containing protein [Saprospiraceae bacterium]
MTEKPAPEQQPLQPQQPTAFVWRLLKNLLRRVENILFGIVVVLIALYFVLQLPSVQNWLVLKTTTYLSSELQTRVELKRVDIEFFDNVILEGLYVEDLNGDTLLFAQKFSAGLSGNFFSILWNRLDFNEINISHAQIYLHKRADQRRDNLNELLFRLGELFGAGPAKKQKKQSPFSIKVQNLNLLDVVFIDERNSFREGEIRTKTMSFKVEEGNVKINHIDLAKNSIDVRSLFFVGFKFDFEKKRSYPPPGFVPYVRPVSLKTDTLKISKPLAVTLGQVRLQNSSFRFDNFRSAVAKELLPEVIDYNHLDVQNIDAHLERVEIYIGEKPAVGADGRPTTEDVFDIFGAIKHFAAQERCGFKVAHGEARRLLLTDSLTALYGAKIETVGGSSIGDTIVLRYDDTEADDPWLDQLGEFNEKVTMDIRLSPGSKFRLGDVRHFDETVFNNEFFKNNKDLIADISGRLIGKLNSKLKADDMDIRLGNSTRVRGEFDGRGLGDNDEPMVLNFDFEELFSDMSTIARIVPGFRPPKQFLKLDKISFNGSYQLFDGFDHVLYGKFATSLGPGRIDMQLNLKNGPEKANYRGDLKMNGFDMATWTGDRNFGPSSFQVNVADNSTGLTLATVDARVSGKIDTFFYKEYNYRDIKLNGKFEKYVFDGKVESDDPNVDFGFDGNINFKDSIPIFDFSAKIRRLDLGKLKLVKQDWVLMGDIKQLELRGRNVDEIVGSAHLQNFKILEDLETWYSLDYLRFSSYFRPDGTRFFGFDSDVAYGQMTGDFSIARAPKNLLNLLGTYHPAFVEELGLPAKDSMPLTDHYDLNIQIRNSRNFSHLISSSLDTLRNVRAVANVDARRGNAYFVVETPLIRFGDTELHDPSIRWQSIGDSAWLYLRLPKNTIGKKNKLPAITLGGPLVGDVFHLKLEAKDETPNSIVESIYLNGELSVVDSLWQLSFNASKIKLFSQEWLIEEDNFIRFGTNYLETKDLELFNGIKRINLESLNQGRGVKFALTNFDLSEVNRFLNSEQISLRGKAYDFEIRIEDVFLMQAIRVDLLSEMLYINEKPYGELLCNFDLQDLSKPFSGKVFLFDKTTRNQRLRVAGGYLFPNEGGAEMPLEGMGMNLFPNEFVADIKADSFPLEVVETIVPEISQTTGLFEAKLLAKGDLNHPTVEGLLKVKEGRFQLDYLKTLFYFKNQPVTFSRNKISADGDTIYDATRQHFGLVYGGLEHEYFKKWRVNCRVESKDENFLVMNTSASDSDLYYGRAEGSFVADFTGSFSRTNIAIEATTGPGTRLFIPLTSTEDAKDIQFINFDKNKPKAEDRKNRSFVISDLKGLNFEMDLSMTEQAEIQLIFDEQAGDIIKGRGEGNIRLGINREGEFTMYGGYQIVRGEYLFTLFNFVNKPFVVTKGGTINWYGDPYGARINLDATYEVNTSVYNFVKAELELLRTLRPRLLDEAAKATRVIVSMNLSGDLLKPNITFGLNFPNISSELKSVTDTKLRLLRQDQAELSRQVFGLVVIGSFLPPSSAGFIQSSDYVATAFNTLTQMISNQFSNYLAGLASEWFGGAVSSLDFDIVYSDYQNDVLSDPNRLGGREVNLRLSSGFKNDRLTVQFGSQFGLGGPGVATADGFLGEDVMVQFAITENRQWRLKAYQRLEPDVSGQRSLRFGLGISFQRDYDTFEDMWKGFGLAFWKRKNGG